MTTQPSPPNSGNESAASLESVQSARQLLDITQLLTSDLHKNQSINVELDSSLDRDLGLDSLAKAELLSRAEQAFKVTLSDQILSLIETPRDLLREVLRAASGTLPVPASTSTAEQTVIKAAGDAQATPSHIQTLQGVLAWQAQAQAHPDRSHIVVCGDRDSEEKSISYRALQENAQALACGLLARGLEPGQQVALMLPTSADYFYCFFAVLLANGIPVPIYPPARPAQVEEHLRRHAGILNNARAKMLISVPQAETVSRLLYALVPGLKHQVTVDELRATEAHPIESTAGPQDTAFLQYTSGSTGDPKGVILSHANLLANIRAMGHTVQATPDDVFVSWLPLYHDMGLIGAWLSSLYFACPLVVMSPLSFLAHPLKWLRTIDRYHGTLSGGPNFAYELCLHKISDEDLATLDLSAWRFAFNGAEPLNPGTLRRFTERFAPCGFCAESMSPVYGLAECSVGLAFPPGGRLPLIDRVQRPAMERDCHAKPAGDDDTDVLEFIASGQPLPGHQIRVVDEQQRELPERHEGNLQFKGPSATCGYFDAADKTAELFQDDWLNTGDRGYLAGGDIYITGRKKDLIIRAGRNLYPHELEAAIADVSGVRKGCVAVFASQDRHTHSEQLIVLAEVRRSPALDKDKLARAEQQTRIINEINNLAMDILGTAPDKVVVAPPHSVPKTSSGKIRRSAARTLYEQGKIGQGRYQLHWQLARLALTSLRPRLRRKIGQLTDLLYGGWSWGVFFLETAFLWPMVAVSSNTRFNWTRVRNACRRFLKLTGTGLKVQGLDHLSMQQRCILVSNHTSYLDVIALIAGLPQECTFVAKTELQQSRFSRIFLRHLETEFVERFDSQRGVSDARRIATAAMMGRSLFFFPEGTFSRSPGLRDFYLGAFVAAAESQLPVVPVTLRGTRNKLRDGSWLLRRGDIEIEIAAPLAPSGSDWNSAVALRDRARAEILQRCGEPNLAQAMGVL
ncbi:AMP-binding protein [Marinobacterium jannaschii]|uniref:AMP-binding protein n=1 Tax=Marinobacterium jannaschii TaxID=64970 RepID=UPI001B806FB1|nr:AMP-binding protein [Marinobacterium jannaschii]